MGLRSAWALGVVVNGVGSGSSARLPLIPFLPEAHPSYNRCISVYLPNCIGALWKKSRSLEHQGLERDRPYAAHLSGSPGRKKGDLSKFIEEAVRWRVFHCTVQDIRERNAGTDPDELQRIIDEAVSEVRAERFAKRKADKA